MNVGGNFPVPVTQQLYLTAGGRVSIAVPEALLGITPHPLSAEFDVDPGWSYWDNSNGVLRVPAGVPNWEQLITPNTTPPAISFAQRKSFVTLQPPSQSNGVYYCPTALAFAPNQSTWIYCDNPNIDNGKGGTRYALGLFSVVSGHPSTPDCILCGTLDIADGNGNRLMFGNYVGNSFTPLSSVNNNITAAQTWPYLALHIQSAGTQSGCSVFAYVFDDEHFLTLGNPAGLSVIQGSSFFFGWYLRATTTAQPAANILQGNILQADFLRISLRDLPPWVR